MKYYTKEIKQKAEIMKKKGYRHHAIAVLLFIVGMFVSVSLTAHGKDINPQQAAKIAKRYVTLSRTTDTSNRRPTDRPTTSYRVHRRQYAGR